MTFKWETLPVWVAGRLEALIKRLCEPLDHEETTRVRAQIALLREIQQLPDQDPNEGYTEREDEDG